ncbi:MAG: 4-hydroxy-2-oxo-heptane-1,7-dioate aldolase [Betaproteobacteria bacterium]|nr:4-hydroxy-2-oxo-heptane-1,7-dioate aldolase [Betaproteobacteria bacterium]
MELPINHFKRAIQNGQQQIGLWCTLSSPYGLEMLAGSGFDWLLIDTEHSPSDVLGVMAQLASGSTLPGFCRGAPRLERPSADQTLFGHWRSTLLLPYIQNAQEAESAVRSVRYPAGGIRGVSALTRASRFGRIKNYAQRCEEELCLLVQIETIEALDQLEVIASVEGIDGVFIGPGDLAASMGYLGQPGHPEVVKKIEQALSRLKACGKPSGILTGDAALAKQFIQWGTVFTAVGVDVALLANASSALSQSFKTN